MDRQTILLVEDDAAIRVSTADMLIAAGYQVLATDRLEVAWRHFTVGRPDLVILDRQLPDGDGLDLCQKIRRHPELGSTPLIMFTVRGDLDEKVKGFAEGADQYLAKPVPAREMLLWVQALLRRLAYDAGEAGVLRAGELEIDPNAHRVKFHGIAVPRLTVKEFDLLYFLVRHRPRVLSRKFILSRLWHTVAVDHLVDTHLANLRKKLPPELGARIQAISGKGYQYLE